MARLNMCTSCLPAVPVASSTKVVHRTRDPKAIFLEKGGEFMCPSHQRTRGSNVVFLEEKRIATSMPFLRFDIKDVRRHELWQNENFQA